MTKYYKKKIKIKAHKRKDPRTGKTVKVKSYARNQNFRYESPQLANHTMFFPPHYEKYAEIIEMDDPESARGSVRKLKREFNQAKTHSKKLAIVKAIQLAENRASAQLDRENLSSREKVEYQKIKQIYGKTADSFWKKL